MKKVYLTEKELADRWNLLPKTLRQWRWYKKGPEYSKIGGRISYQVKDVRKFERVMKEQNWTLSKKRKT